MKKASDTNALVLTFDDGPGRNLTPEILDKLSEYDAKATFFLLGRNIVGRENVVKQIAENGHEICSHSYSHLNHWKVSPLRAISDIENGWEAINKALGRDDAFYPFRPPFGKLSLISLIYLLRKKVPICYWTQVSGDTWQLSRHYLNKGLMQARKRGGSVFLMHDFDRTDESINERVIKSLDTILQLARQTDMKIMTFSELSEMATQQHFKESRCLSAENCIRKCRVSEMVDVTVMVVNWNTRDLLYDCLRSLEESAGDVSREVIVVDNNSSDGSVDMVREHFPEVKIIANDKNLGFAAANNQAIAISRGRYLLLLNSDTIVCDSAIEKTITYADQNPQAAIVGLRVINDPETVEMTCFKFPDLLSVLFASFGFEKMFKTNKFFGRERMQWWQRDTYREVDVVSGMYMLVRREAVHENGVMDDSFFFYYEETDWCYRFAKAGWKCLFYPDAEVIHVGGGAQSSAKAMVKMFVQQQKSCLIFMSKHKGPVKTFIARALLALGFGVRVVVWSIFILVKKLSDMDAREHVKKKLKSQAAFMYLLFGIEP